MMWKFLWCKGDGMTGTDIRRRRTSTRLKITLTKPHSSLNKHYHNKHKVKIRKLETFTYYLELTGIHIMVTNLRNVKRRIKMEQPDRSPLLPKYRLRLHQMLHRAPLTVI